MWIIRLWRLSDLDACLRLGGRAGALEQEETHNSILIIIHYIFLMHALTAP